jgi:methionine-rich copper-binding protein CopC
MLKNIVILPFIFSLLFSLITFPQIIPPGLEKTEDPFSFSVTKDKNFIRIGVEESFVVKITPAEGYKVNMIPPFTIEASLNKDMSSINAIVMLNQEEIESAKIKIANSESVYLETKQNYTFKIKFPVSIKPGKHDIKWTLTLFYCSDTDHMCYRKSLSKTKNYIFSN